MLADIYAVLERKADEWLAGEGVDDGHRQIDFEADLRYGHDGRILSLPLQPDSLDNDGLADLATRFATAHRRRFGFDSEETVELVALRAVAGAAPPPPAGRRYESGDRDASAAIVDEHPVWFDDRFVATSRYDRERLRSGHRLHGPAIVAQPDATTIVLPGYVASVDAYLNLLIEPDRQGGDSGNNGA